MCAVVAILWRFLLTTLEDSFLLPVTLVMAEPDKHGQDVNQWEQYAQPLNQDAQVQRSVPYYNHYFYEVTDNQNRHAIC